MNRLQYTWVLWDLLAVGILAYFIWRGALKGFVQTLVGLLGYVAAAVVARVGGPILAQLLYDNVVRDALRVILMGRVEDILADGAAAAGDIIGSIPESLQRIMTGDSLDPALDSAAAQVVESIIDSALMDPVMSILQGLMFLLLFSLVMMIARHITRLFYGVGRIPVLGSVNTLLGGLVGVVQAALALVVLSLALQLVILFTGGFSWLNTSVMEETFVLRVFYRLFTL